MGVGARRGVALLVLGAGLTGWSAAAQAPAPADATVVRLQRRLDQLSAQLQQDQQRLAAEQAAIAVLKDQLAQQVVTLQNQQSVNTGKIDTQYQTKVASGSRFRVTLSGLLLMNVYANAGTVENSDVPNLALAPAAGASGGDFGATARQSEIGLRVNGATLAGARASGEILADFYGGFPGYLDATASGLLRLKIARGRLDWSHTSFLFGVDEPWISPLSPTSYASLGTPALAYSGNLWTWTPQIGVEQRWNLGEGWQDALRVGLMDPLSGEFPVRTAVRKPEAGEASRQPAFEVHEALGRELFGRDFSFGGGAYTSRQAYGFGRSVPAWAATGDWNLALAPWLDASGEVYRGRAIGGLWGGVGHSVVSSADDLTDPATRIAGLEAAGGWGQLKFHLSPTLELNAVYGLDNPFTADLRRFAATAASNPIARNQTALVNLIERPRSDLVFALEYRRLRTARLTGPARTAGHVDAAVGVSF